MSTRSSNRIDTLIYAPLQLTVSSGVALYSHPRPASASYFDALPKCPSMSIQARLLHLFIKRSGNSTAMQKSEDLFVEMDGESPFFDFEGVSTSQRIPIPRLTYPPQPQVKIQPTAKMIALTRSTGSQLANTPQSPANARLARPGVVSNPALLYNNESWSPENHNPYQSNLSRACTASLYYYGSQISESSNNSPFQSEAGMAQVYEPSQIFRPGAYEKPRKGPSTLAQTSPQPSASYNIPWNLFGAVETSESVTCPELFCGQKFSSAEACERHIENDHKLFPYSSARGPAIPRRVKSTQ